MRGSLLSPSVLSIGGRAAGRPRGEFFAAFFAVARGGDDGIESTATGHGHGGVGLEVLNQVQWREPTMVAPCGASGGLDESGRPEIYARALQMIEAQA